MSRNVMIDEWYPVGLVSQLDAQRRKTALMGEPIEVRLGEDGNAKVTGGNGRALPACIRYGHVWSSLGDPQKPLFAIPEADQPGRRLVDVGVVRVRCSPCAR
jgi:phenylpropionate dioxygenase-like ring-hydroxylating dioxygenase large terminal subunit